MVIARVLWGFDIRWPVDENGQKVEQDIMKMVYGFMSTPEEFQATFKVRSEKHARIFRQEWAGLFHQVHSLIISSTEGRNQICSSQALNCFSSE
jgi:hypothetical protein